MSATATSQEVRQPVSRIGSWIAAAIAVVSLAALIAVGVATFTRDSAAAVQFDPTAAQRIHLAREYGSTDSFDATGALQAHVLRENDAAAPGTLFDHVLRENQPD